jgi:hypothetical protein
MMAALHANGIDVPKRIRERTLKRMRSARAVSDNVKYVLLTHFCTLVLLHGGMEDALEQVEASLLDVCRVSVRAPGRQSEDLNEQRQYVQELVGQVPKGKAWQHVVRDEADDVLSRAIIGRTRKILDLSATLKPLARALSGYCMVTDWMVGETLRVPNERILVRLPLPAAGQWLKVVEEFKTLHEQGDDKDTRRGRSAHHGRQK